MLPAIDCAAGGELLWQRDFREGKLYGPILRNIYFECFVERDGFVDEAVLEPEFAGRGWLENVRDDFVFDDVAGGEHGRGDVEFLAICKGRRVVRESYGNIAGGVGIGGG